MFLSLLSTLRPSRRNPSSRQKVSESPQVSKLHYSPEVHMMLEQIRKQWMLLQKEVGTWAWENFGRNISKVNRHIALGNVGCVLGITEEIGELVAGMDRLGQARDAVADVQVYLADYIHRLGSTCPTELIDWMEIQDKLIIECRYSDKLLTSSFMLSVLGRF